MRTFCGEVRYKPRTSPYSFQGLEGDGLKILREAGDANQMPVVTEVTDPRCVELVDRYADMLQIGARNMQNFVLLKEVGKVRKPVLLKRGMSATVTDLLMSAEYVLSQGNSQVVLCERGVRGFDTKVARNLYRCGDRGGRASNCRTCRSSWIPVMPPVSRP